jgi:hypothetical protein
VLHDAGEIDNKLHDGLLPMVNETPGSLERDGHNALFGYLHCQQVCPENRPYRDRVHEGPTLDAAKTQLLLSGAKKEDLPEAIVPVLAEWRIDEILEYLPRNLGVLAEREKARRKAVGRTRCRSYRLRPRGFERCGRFLAAGRFWLHSLQ